ncbi:caspase family protein [Devosia sp. SL43]|uniref:caspase family protein n=1 Tax=Devosia sp. SL43 TaxID=2806348 RepID=UPI001F235103|nr:caspase family protein [Devosia sp. SL43]UJW84722.1 caspase family protein [Devosia sp. SL43]
MRDLAIVLYASDYTNAGKLPACQRDAKAIQELLLASDQFDDVTLIDGNLGSSAAKDALIDFAKRYETEDVGTLFFYFSGHGRVKDGQFFHLLADYAERQIRQTSIENYELDQILKSLSPNLCVKVVDACQSGFSYVKEGAEFKEYVSKSSEEYKSVYFMYSSQSTESSFADDRMSYFTNSFLSSIIRRKSNGIRYKDIVDYISDDFSSSGLQTPAFVIQAKLTEVFMPVTDEIIRRLEPYLANSPFDTPKAESKLSLAERIRFDASRYLERTEAMAIVESVHSALAELKLTGEVEGLFTAEAIAEERQPPSADLIGDWINRNNADKALFAKAVTKQESYTERVLKRSSFGLLTNYTDPFKEKTDEDYEFTTKYRTVVSDFEHTTDMPFTYVRVRLTPAVKNLAPEELLVVPVISLTSIRVFYGFSHFKIVDWGKVQRLGKVVWQTAEFEMTDAKSVLLHLDSVWSEFLTFVEGGLLERFPNVDEEAALVPDKAAKSEHSQRPRK